MAKTCGACRERKVRCDGVTPICGPCSKARRPIQCIYVSSNAVASKGPLLQKGAACYPCRRKKKRCDAKHPFCTTCKVAGKEYDCQYEDNIERSLTEALIARTRDLEQRLAYFEGQSQASSAAPSQSVASSSCVTVEMNDFLSSLASFPPIFAQYPFTPGVNLAPNVEMPFPLVTSLPLQSVASQSEIISPLVDSHYLTTSTSYQDLDEFRALFISHHGQLGLFLSEEKTQAILLADLSGRVVHPVLVYAAQLMGCRLWQEQHRAVCTITTESYQLRSVQQALLNTGHPVTRLQVHNVLTIYFLIKQHMQEGRDQLVKAANLVMQYSLRFQSPAITGTNLLQEPNIEAREQICALSQLLYLDKAACIVLNESTLLSVEFEQDFATLSYVFPAISRHNLVVLRARSVFFLHQTRCLSSQPSSPVDFNVPAHSQGQWYDQYWHLLAEVSEHIAILSPSMLKSTAFRDRERGLTLKLCMLVSLTASAELHRLLASHHAESRLKCLDVVFEIVGITRGLKDDDYIFLDPILGICWTMVATIFNQERDHHNDKYSAVHWRSLLAVIVYSASKLGHTLPFMENSLVTINGAISTAEESSTE
ncbi:hypothetical protein BKA93DRAFT_891062 [Sparassis latifolia]|uniref:Zn(2)-C6 fungal-type domain-containing protein n=1 Tax=Sparassis crispa TaxID=139825 RepID=A0A401GJH0_9APHY|nr:hypothetical protein SCP_0407010 [Sparassis crispa]GBE82317.1 hypothetical protein SCP_0407010 [Sparassis crispa]